MKKFSINFCVILIVVFSLSYSLCALTAQILTDRALNNFYNKQIPLSSERLLCLASKINPFDSEPYYQKARILHAQGLKESKIQYFKEALALLLKAQKLNTCNPVVDLLILEVQNLLGRSPAQSFSELKALNKKFSNNHLVEKLLIEQGLMIWGSLESEEKEMLEKITRLLLSHRLLYKKYLYLIGQFMDKTQNPEVLKRIIPKKSKVLNYLKGEILKHSLRVDYAWLAQTTEEAKKNEKTEGKSASSNERKFQNIKETWKSRFGEAKTILTNEHFLGWFQSGKEITKGNLWSNGTIFGLGSLKPDSRQLIIKAKSSRVHDIPAYMLVRINNVILGGCYVESKDFQEYAFPVSNTTATESLVSISFENDYSDRKNNEDRNLSVQSMEVR